MDPAARLPFSSPQWLGSWFEIYPYYETIAAQLLAAAFVIGSYYLAEYLKVTRPLRRGSGRPCARPPARRAVAAVRISGTRQIAPAPIAGDVFDAPCRARGTRSGLHDLEPGRAARNVSSIWNT